MTTDIYLQNILARESIYTGPTSFVKDVRANIEPIIRQWAGRHLVSMSPSGSFAKGTANRSGTDIDLFISLSSQVSETLKEIYDKLFNLMINKGYSATRQNVSINIRVNGFDVDLVPGKRQDSISNNHSLYRRRAGTWTKTNVVDHIKLVALSGRKDEIRILKLWRNQKGLDFPSFYLELTVIDALRGRYKGRLSDNVWHCLEYLRDSFSTARIIDPANTNNIISDDLTAAEKDTIAAAAKQARTATDWKQIVI
jgi:hypothetical protein